MMIVSYLRMKDAYPGVRGQPIVGLATCSYRLQLASMLIRDHRRQAQVGDGVVDSPLALRRRLPNDQCTMSKLISVRLISLETYYRRCAHMMVDGLWAIRLAAKELNSKQSYLPSTIALVRFWFLNYKIAQDDPLTFDTICFFSGFGTIGPTCQCAMLFFFLFSSFHNSFFFQTLA